MPGEKPRLDYLDAALAHAIFSIENQYGDVVTVLGKNQKALLKFGRNPSVGTTVATVMTLAGSETVETFVPGNTITHFAGAAADTADVVVEGHTVGASGFTFVVQTVTLDGTTKTPLTTPLARISRGYNDGATDLVGPVYFAEDVTFTGGVPQTASAVHLIIPAGRNQSQKASSTLDMDTYGIVTEINGDVLKKSAADVTFSFEVRLFGKTFREQLAFSASDQSDSSRSPRPHLIIPPNSDFRLQALADAASTEVGGSVNMYLARKVTAGEFGTRPLYWGV